MLKRIREMFKNEKGLTLVELLAVIVILAIVGAIAFVMIGNIIDNSKKDAAVADALQAIDAAKLYEIETTGETPFPVKISVLQGTETDDPKYLDTLYDPWDKAPYGTEATDQVAKDDDKYTVALEASKCKINATEAKLIEEGRKACGQDLSS